MKTLIKTILSFGFIVFGLPVSAADSQGQFYAKIEGQTFYFKIRSSTKRTVELTNDGTLTYSGEIVIPEKVTDSDTGIEYTIDYLKQYAFKNQTTLTRLELPNTIVDLGHYVFEGCTNLNTVIFGTGLENLWKYTFTGCTNLKTMAFGKSDKYFENYTFSGVNNATAVYLTDPVPKDVKGQEPFATVGQTATLYVPYGTRDAYRTKLGWRQFVNIEEFILLDEDETLTLNVAVSGLRVVFQRTMKAGQWNSYCAPLALTSAEISEVFGTGTEVLAFSPATTEKTLKFYTTTTIEANTPYMVKPTKSWRTYVFSSHDVAQPAAGTVSSAAYRFTGVFDNGYVPQNAYFLSGNTYYKAVSANTNRLKGYRTYLSAVSASPAKFLSFVIDEMPTGVENVETGNKGDERFCVYGLDGRIMRKSTSSLEGLPQGVYVVDGKKRIVK